MTDEHLVPGYDPFWGTLVACPSVVFSLPGVVGLMLGQLVELLFLLSLLCLVGCLSGLLPARSYCLCPSFLTDLAVFSHSSCTVVDLLACVASSRGYVLLTPSHRSPQLLKQELPYSSQSSSYNSRWQTRLTLLHVSEASFSWKPRKGAK